MFGRTLHFRTFRGLGIFCALSLAVGGFPAQAQNSAQAPNEENFGPAPAAVPDAAQLLSPDQLDNVVAPIALYPDQLLSEVLAASTYPLELVVAQQWLQQNGNLQGVQLMDSARQQNWDPSIQALVAFPDVMNLLTRDVQWTTTLGNAFLAQQADVMNAIQRMRARAQANGRLHSSPQQLVSTQQQDGQNAIEIQPANPQMMYVPSYNPQYVWGPPAYGGDYPQLGYPSFGQIFGTVVNLASFFLGFASLFSGGWGWGLSWLTHSLFLNGLFFSHFGFHGGGMGGGGFYGGGYNARSVWVHNPGHRMGVPYSNRLVASRFGGSFRPAAGFGSREGFGARSGFGGTNSFASRAISGSNGWRTPGGAGERSFEAGRTSQFTGNRGFPSSFSGAGNGAGGWHSPSAGNTFGGSRAGPSYASNFGSSYNSAGNRGFSSYNGTSSGFRGSSPSGYSSSPRSSFASPQRSPGNEFRASASPQHFGQQNLSQHFSAPKAQHFSAPKAQHFSAPKASRSSGSHGGGQGGGGGHSHGGSHKH